MRVSVGYNATIVLTLLLVACGDASMNDSSMDDASMNDASMNDVEEGDSSVSRDAGFDARVSFDAASEDSPSVDAAPIDSAVIDIACSAIELCDGVDNDCDGNVDEGAPMMPCGADEGLCMSGVQRCIAGVYAECEGQVDPSGELCDGFDNDCNGSVDDGIAPRPCGTNVGACRAGARSCIDGSMSGCIGQIGSTEEICDGVDNNCDGDVDNGVPPRSCGTNVGACRAGTRRCVAGEFASCIGRIRESTEIDDRIDNDCDGATDEGFPCVPDGRARQNFNALNDMRRARGLPVMRCNRRLRYAAEKHAQWLCDTGATVPTHVGQGGSTDQQRIAAEGVTFNGWAENVGVGFSSGQAVHNAWMASDVHRPALIARGLSRVGIAYVRCGGRHWWVQDFAN